MNIFTEINQRIKKSTEGGYLGYYPFNEFDQEDKDELKSWEPQDNTNFQKEVNGKLYNFDLILQE